ncbi:MAG: hypothetical protein JNL72_06090 [Flavipsychrobacter sp.]|nr:hypothetical protein [Flavipsychrobacter sp.]
MTPLPEQEIIKFLKEHIEPLEDTFFGSGYRASVYLIDGTFLPCVIFRNSGKTVNLAIRRFKEEQTGKSVFSRSSGLGYYDIVKNFVTKGNCVNYYDIARVEKSRFAFPLNIQRQIQGETTMSWTGFSARMKDGKYFGFGTAFRWEFFQMPDNYSVDDIEEIVNHSYVSQTGELKSHREGFNEWPKDHSNTTIYRERAFFECYLDSL